jgi:Cation transporter/ATPase, N-terminus
MSTAATATLLAPTLDTTAWQATTAEEACDKLGVSVDVGLDPAEVERRRERYGANKLAEAKKEPGWHAFLRQYKDLMQLVLVAAAVVSVVALDEWHTAIVVLAVTLLNAILGLNQEGKAAESVAALQMIGAAVVLAFLVTGLAPLQRIFGTISLTSRQWGICLLGPIALLLLLELGKFVDRRFGQQT